MKALFRGLCLVCALAWAGLIYYLSDRPSIDVPALFAYQDKMFHLLVYAVLGFLVLGAMRQTVAGYAAGQAWLAIALAGLYGLLDEYHQSFVPGRDATAGDLAADFTGAVLGAGTLYLLVRRLAIRTSNAPAK